MPFVRNGQTDTVTIPAGQSIALGALYDSAVTMTLPAGVPNGPLVVLQDTQQVYGPYASQIVVSVGCTSGIAEYVVGAAPALTQVPGLSGATTIAGVTGLQAALDSKQATLVSATNIKTINGTTLLGSGDLVVSGGGGVTDGDKGDIVVSASGATWLLDSAVVTAAAKTVLDDATVAAMVNTLGGATSTGSGGLARATSPTFVTPVLGTPTSGTLTNCTGLPTAGLVDASVTLAKMANLAQDQFIGRTTASTGVPQTATITAAARTVLDDTTVAAMVDTLGGATSTGTGGIARAASPAFTGTPTAPTAAVATNTTQVATTAFVRAEIANISGAITTAKTSFSNTDKALALDAASSDAPVTITGAVIRTVPVGTSLGTTGSVALDFATLVGTRQSITASGNITFTTSNLAAGRGFELRIGAGGSTRTLTWPAWVAFGAALPTSLASGATLIVSLFANSTTDASVDAVAVVSA